MYYYYSMYFAGITEQGVIVEARNFALLFSSFTV